MANTTISDFYSLNNGTDIVLEVKIKKAQIAKTTVRLDKNAAKHYKNSFKVSLGKSKDLIGKMLYVDTTEADVDPDSNETSFALLLSGGAMNYKNQRVQTVAPGGYVIYTAEIIFIP